MTELSKNELLSFKSNFLNKEMGINVYLPPNYDCSKKYPTLYFLHGRTGNENIYKEIEMNKIADRLIGQGRTKPLIIVFPRIDNSHGMNSLESYMEMPDSSDDRRKVHLGRYEDYLINEVIPLIDSKYSTINDRCGRYIGGISAGGYAALHNAFRHAKLFSKVGGHMPALEEELDEDDAIYYSDQNIWNKYNPIFIAKNYNLPNIEVYLDCGDMDEGKFYIGCGILADVLKTKGISVENHVFQGRHNSEYIKAHVEKYLLFYMS